MPFLDAFPGRGAFDRFDRRMMSLPRIALLCRGVFGVWRAIRESPGGLTAVPKGGDLDRVFGSLIEEYAVVAAPKSKAGSRRFELLDLAATRRHVPVDALEDLHRRLSPFFDTSDGRGSEWRSMRRRAINRIIMHAFTNK
jgi:hypothetical protein